MLSRFRAAKAAEDGKGAKVIFTTIYSELATNGGIVCCCAHDLVDHTTVTVQIPTVIS